MGGGRHIVVGRRNCAEIGRVAVPFYIHFGGEADVARACPHEDEIDARLRLPGSPLGVIKGEGIGGQGEDGAHFGAPAEGELIIGFELLFGAEDAGVLLLDVDLHGLFAEALARIFEAEGERERFPFADMAVEAEIGIGEGRIGEPVPEGKEHGSFCAVVEAVAREDALAVFRVVLVLVIVSGCGGIFVSKRPCLGEPSRRADFAEQNVCRRRAAAAARKIGEKDGLCLALPRERDGRTRSQDDGGFGVGFEHRLDEGVVGGGQRERGAVLPFRFARFGEPRKDDGLRILLCKGCGLLNERGVGLGGIAGVAFGKDDFCAQLLELFESVFEQNGDDLAAAAALIAGLLCKRADDEDGLLCEERQDVLIFDEDGGLFRRAAGDSEMLRLHVLGKGRLFLPAL